MTFVYCLDITSRLLHSHCLDRRPRYTQLRPAMEFSTVLLSLLLAAPLRVRSQPAAPRSFSCSVVLYSAWPRHCCRASSLATTIEGVGNDKCSWQEPWCARGAGVDAAIASCCPPVRCWDRRAPSASKRHNSHVWAFHSHAAVPLADPQAPAFDWCSCSFRVSLAAGSELPIQLVDC